MFLSISYFCIGVCGWRQRLLLPPQWRCRCTSLGVQAALTASFHQSGQISVCCVETGTQVGAGRGGSVAANSADLVAVMATRLMNWCYVSVLPGTEAPRMIPIG